MLDETVERLRVPLPSTGARVRFGFPFQADTDLIVASPRWPVPTQRCISLPKKGDALSPRRTNCILGREAMKKTLACWSYCRRPVGAQDPISLKDAVRLALDKNKSIEASTAAAESGQEPRHGGSERVSCRRSTTPSPGRERQSRLLFSSLLTQHQFGEQNFRSDR